MSIQFGFFFSKDGTHDLILSKWKIYFFCYTALITQNLQIRMVFQCMNNHNNRQAKKKKKKNLRFVTSNVIFYCVLFLREQTFHANFIVLSIDAW